MQILKHNKQPRKTKRQLKLINGANAMVKRSLKAGDKILNYIGKAPIYFNKASLMQPANYVKVSLGIPFVNKYSVHIKI